MNGRRRVIRIELDRHSSLISGPGAHELIRTVSNRNPVWISTLKGFSVQESTARDVIALAERIGAFDVEIIGRRTRIERAREALLTAPAPRWPEQADPGGGLW